MIETLRLCTGRKVIAEHVSGRSEGNDKNPHLTAREQWIYQ